MTPIHKYQERFQQIKAEKKKSTIDQNNEKLERKTFSLTWYAMMEVGSEKKIPGIKL